METMTPKTPVACSDTAGPLADQSDLKDKSIKLDKFINNNDTRERYREQT
ncbi:MAG: hypothetical protein QXV48_04920 [Desulfurococcaceae archaeon]